MNVLYTLNSAFQLVNACTTTQFADEIACCPCSRCIVIKAMFLLHITTKLLSERAHENALLDCQLICSET